MSAKEPLTPVIVFLGFLAAYKTLPATSKNKAKEIMNSLPHGPFATHLTHHQQPPFLRLPAKFRWSDGIYFMDWLVFDDDESPTGLRVEVTKLESTKPELL